MSAYSDAVLADTPEAWWRLGVADVGDTVAIDQMGNHNGTYVDNGFGIATQGRDGATADGDGAVLLEAAKFQWITANTAAALFDDLVDWSAEGWINQTPDATFRRFWSAEGTGANVSLVSQEDFLVVSIDANDVIVVGGIEPGWHQIVVTWAAADGATVLYVDGVQAGTGTQARAASTMDEFTIGAQNDGSNLEGEVDEVSLYSAVLSPERVLAHFEAASQSDELPFSPGAAALALGLLGD